ncbi:uncharacterized protein TrAFT101_008322 [Trichoderma asperellum]|uniref:uncharacterized protein n=1 Tax=Trichoderma asperellum TaxID=101201 RepID=UPI0033335451|nr:hypothetical protein TrAFT101_008322 [Trichoderma asperellum]
MASADDNHKPVSVHLVIAIILAVLIFLNILIGIVYLLIPKDWLECHGAAHRRAAAAAEDGGGFYHRARRNPHHGYHVARSIYISGSEGQQVTIINGVVEVDDELDAWAYWATDSEETLRGIPLNTAQPQYQPQNQYGMHNDGVIAARATPAGTVMASNYDYRHSYEQDAPEMQLTSDGIITSTPGQRGLVLDLAGYDVQPPMESAPDRVVTRAPLARNIDVFPPPPHTPSTVRTWGRDSDATIRPVVESPRREIAGARDKRNSRQAQREECL